MCRFRRHLGQAYAWVRACAGPLGARSAPWHQSPPAQLAACRRQVPSVYHVMLAKMEGSGDVHCSMLSMTMMFSSQGADLAR